MPTFGVTVAVVREDGWVLLQQREDFAVWCLPGGAVDPGESAAAAAVREVREETGIEARLTQLVGVYSQPAWNRGGGHALLFAAAPVGGALRPDPTESLAVGFFDPAALPAPLLWPHRVQVAHVLAGVAGAACTLRVAWPFDRWLTREELYALRDGDPTVAPRLRAELCREPVPGDCVFDLGAPPPAASPPSAPPG